LILSNADPRTTFLRLVDPSAWDPRFVTHVQAIKYRGCAARVFLALVRAPRLRVYAQLASSLLLSPSLVYAEKAYDDVKHGRLSAHPILSVHVPSSLDPDRAPEGRHLMEVTVQYVPYSAGPVLEQSARYRWRIPPAPWRPSFEAWAFRGGTQVWTPFDLEQQSRRKATDRTAR
jgi:phytoene dehydrogenase-like protein